MLQVVEATIEESKAMKIVEKRRIYAFSHRKYLENISIVKKRTKKIIEERL